MFQRRTASRVNDTTHSTHLEVRLVERHGFRELCLGHTGVRVDVELEPVLFLLVRLQSHHKHGQIWQKISADGLVTARQSLLRRNVLVVELGVP